MAIDNQLRQEQAGYRCGRSCNDQIFTLRQITEKTTVWQRPVIMHFIDFMKASNCIHCKSLWCILKKYGIPRDVIVIIQNLSDEGQSAVKWSGTIGEWFKVMTGVRQGCILSPILFAFVMNWTMRKALSDTDIRLEWTHGSKLSDLDYADDIVLLDSSRDRRQSMTEAVENEGRKVKLIMNQKKCKVMVSNAWEDSEEIKIG